MTVHTPSLALSCRAFSFQAAPPYLPAPLKDQSSVRLQGKLILPHYMPGNMDATGSSFMRMCLCRGLNRPGKGVDETWIAFLQAGIAFDKS